MIISSAVAPAQTAMGTTPLTFWAELAVIVTAVTLVIVGVAAFALLLRVNALLEEFRRSAHQNFGPVSDRARKISDNVEFVTQALRTDVEKLNASVRGLSDRLQLASERMEERIEEFNALMEVVQDEAEDIFLDTASTVRGVREGARAISTPRDARPPSPPLRSRAVAGAVSDTEEGADEDAQPTSSAAPSEEDHAGQAPER